MSDTVIVAIVSGSASMLTAITALILNHKGFVSLERRIERIENDLKEFYKSIAELDKRITVMEKRS